MVDSKKEPKDQNKLLGANYIAEFFLEIKTLTEQYANYKNIYLELENVSKNSESKVDSDQFANCRIAIQNIRFISNKVYVHFRTLKKILKLSDDDTKEIILSYEKIIDSSKTLPDYKEIEDFVIEINTLLATDVIRNLLQTSQDILSELYGQS